VHLTLYGKKLAAASLALNVITPGGVLGAIKEYGVVVVGSGSAMNIHPALSEVVERAAGSLVPVEHYHNMLREYGLEAS